MTQHRMRSEELQQLLGTVDILQLLLLQGRHELRILAPYLLSFGAYGVICTVAELFGYNWWAIGVLPAFALATAIAVGVMPTVLYWGAVAVGVVLIQ